MPPGNGFTSRTGNPEAQAAARPLTPAPRMIVCTNRLIPFKR